MEEIRRTIQDDRKPQEEDLDRRLAAQVVLEMTGRGGRRGLYLKRWERKLLTVAKKVIGEEDPSSILAIKAFDFRGNELKPGDPIIFPERERSILRSGTVHRITPHRVSIIQNPASDREAERFEMYPSRKFTHRRHSSVIKLPDAA